MSAVFALIVGVLFKPAEEKTSSKTGRTFVSATIKVGGETGDAEFWSITAFSQSVQSELLRLGAGDALSCQGKVKIELWQPRDGGEVKISRSLFADQILALKAVPRERRAKAAASTPLLDQTPAKETAAAGGPAFFSDEIPFGPAR
jgi:single-stranded DNA-binding protein